MTVRSDDEIARADQPFLGQERMFDTHFADVEEIFHALRFCERAATFALFRALDVLVRDEVIHNERDLAFVENLAAAVGFDLFYSHGRGDVVSENEIEFRRDELTRDYGFEPRVRRQYFL